MVANIKQGTMTVAEYEDFFYSHNFVRQQNDEQYLISIAKAGLNEEIREGLETPEFPTLEALFEEAMEVEEILEMDKTPPSNPIKRPGTNALGTAMTTALANALGTAVRRRKMRKLSLIHI